ncbi:MAG: hypothetical protein E5Y58_05060 [Mesorhizobium sp.]|nr:MAG: hypothetical protein E5Y58_05060 [Mesorhizobium sp.]
MGALIAAFDQAIPTTTTGYCSSESDAHVGSYERGPCSRKVELRSPSRWGPLEFVLADNEPRPGEHEVFTRPP